MSMSRQTRPRRRTFAYGSPHLSTLRADAGAGGDDYTVALVDRAEGCADDADFFRDGLSARIGESLAAEILELSPEEARQQLAENFGVRSDGESIVDDTSIWRPDSELAAEIAVLPAEERPAALLDAYNADEGARGTWYT